jgi:DNA-binding MarR family transcriptional regulator
MDKTLLHILMHNGRLLERAIELELMPTGLHHGQGRLLQAIAASGEITQADLARQMDIRPATVTNMLKPLEEKNLIRRKIDPQTNRAMVVSLTSAGEQACEQVQAAWERVEARISKTISKTNRDGLFQGLEKVRSTLGGKSPEEENS